MKKSTILKLIVVVLAIVAVVVSATMVRSDITALSCETCEGAGTILEAACEDCGGEGYVGVSNYYATFVSLLPPILAIILALLTKEVYSSLFIGIVLAGLFSANFNPVVAMDNVLGVDCDEDDESVGNYLASSPKQWKEK